MCSVDLYFLGKIQKKERYSRTEKHWISKAKNTLMHTREGNKFLLLCVHHHLEEGKREGMYPYGTLLCRHRQSAYRAGIHVSREKKGFENWSKQNLHPITLCMYILYVCYVNIYTRLDRRGIAHRYTLLSSTGKRFHTCVEKELYSDCSQRKNI